MFTIKEQFFDSDNDDVITSESDDDSNGNDTNGDRDCSGEEPAYKYISVAWASKRVQPTSTSLFFADYCTLCA